MAEANGNWEWLDKAAQEARETIDRLYLEGHHQLDGEPTTPPAGTTWPAETERRS